MKKFSVAMLTGCLSLSVQAELMITAVFDGPLSGGVPKGVELYATTDIADLSLYGIGSANNGGGTDGEEFTFPSISLTAGDYLYVASESTGFESFFCFSPDYTSFAMSINGDDAIELFRNGEVIDLYGDPNVDGTGTAWDHLDGWAYRVPGSVASGSFDDSEWVYSGTNALDGTSQNDPASMIPLGTFVGGPARDDCTVSPTPSPEITLISAIQGTPQTHLSNVYGETDVSPLIDQQVVVEAVVVGDFQDGDSDESRNLSGFFIQEETSDEDANPASSEGLFVYYPGLAIDVNPGDRVRLSGTVDQYYGETQLSSITGLEVLASDQLGSVTPALVSLADNTSVSISGADGYQADLEAYEGMLVELSDSVQITEQYQLDRFNEIRVAAGARPVQFTQLNAPNAAAYDAWLQAIAARTVVYDDGLNVQNAHLDRLQGFAPYHEASAKRMGDSADNLTGVLDYKWAGNSASQSTWRIRSHLDGANSFTSTLDGNSPNPRPQTAPAVSGNLKLVSFNVLNLFTTLDNGAITAAGHEPRGADNQAEFDRQLQKTVNALLAMDADILGLVELENEFDTNNDGSTAIEVLVNAANAQLAGDVYDYVYPGTQFVGSDAIAVGLIYKSTTVALAEGSVPAILEDNAAADLPVFAGRDFSEEPLFNGIASNRASLAASFVHLATGDSLTVAVNHFKSKGASSLEDENSPDYDQRDGAGFWNLRRLDAAIAVDAWLQTNPTGLADTDIAILGDLNAYAAEQPVQYLLAQGYNNVEDDSAYSYVFDGQVGTLDYTLLSDSLFSKLAEAHVWHINADEADAIDYNTDFGRSTAYYNGGTATRNSDHDPVLVGLQMVPQINSPTDLLNLFMALKDSGEIDGSGGRELLKHYSLWRFEKKLNQAVNFFNRKRVEKTCVRLRQADLASDGDATDLILGSGVQELNAGLNRLIALLDCPVTN